MFPLFLNFLLCCLPECYSGLRFFACLFYFLLSFYFSLSYYLPGLCYQICYVIYLFSASAVSSCVCYVTKLFLQGFHYFIICLLRHCSVHGFDSSIFYCYVTVLSLKGFHRFSIYLLRHCSVLGLSCLLFCLLRRNAISSGFPLFY